MLPFFLKSGPKELRQLDRWGWLQTALSGFFIFIHFYFFFRSVQETTVANSTILFCTNPLFTALGALLFFREKISTHLITAALLGGAGVVILLGGDAFYSKHLWQGDLWGLACAATFSAYILSGKFLRLRISNLTYAFSIYLQTVLWSAALMWQESIPFFNYSQSTWIAFFALAIFPTLLGHAIFTYCLRFLNVNFMSCATLIQPVFATASAAWFFNEQLSSSAAAGFLLTAVAVIILYFPYLKNWWKPLTEIDPSFREKK